MLKVNKTLERYPCKQGRNDSNRQKMNKKNICIIRLAFRGERVRRGEQDALGKKKGLGTRKKKKKKVRDFSTSRGWPYICSNVFHDKFIYPICQIIEVRKDFFLHNSPGWPRLH